MPNSVTSDSLVLPIDGELAMKVMRRFDMSPSDPHTTIISATEHPIVRRIRGEFCKRVSRCRGVIQKKCWALGAAAMEEVLRKVL